MTFQHHLAALHDIIVVFFHLFILMGIPGAFGWLALRRAMRLYRLPSLLLPLALKPSWTTRCSNYLIVIGLSLWMFWASSGLVWVMFSRHTIMTWLKYGWLSLGLLALAFVLSIRILRRKNGVTWWRVNPDETVEPENARWRWRPKDLIAIQQIHSDQFTVRLTGPCPCACQHSQCTREYATPQPITVELTTVFTYGDCILAGDVKKYLETYIALKRIEQNKMVTTAKQLQALLPSNLPEYQPPAIPNDYRTFTLPPAPPVTFSLHLIRA